MNKRIKTWLAQYPGAYFLAQVALYRVSHLLNLVIPDKLFLHLQYFLRLGRLLNLRNPVLYNEKIQWLKLYYRDPLLRTCVDKWAVREYVASKGLAGILVATYGVFDCFDAIDFDVLPTQFVLKLTNGSSFNVICTDKSALDRAVLSRQFKAWQKIRFSDARREWAYEQVPNRIMCEQLLRARDGSFPADYRFFCFHGKASVIAVDLESVVNGKKLPGGYHRHLFGKAWEPIPAVIQYPPQTGRIVPKPKLLEEMLRIAETLAEDFPAVRVDLYLVDDRVYFGELTFYHASGYQKIWPIEFERFMGGLLDLAAVRDTYLRGNELQR